MLAAPSPISSWSGTMRWRRLAASVCATETDSTKPISEIRSAGTASVPRYVVVLFPLYIAAALIVRSRALCGALVALMGLAQMVLFARWSLGYWVA